MKMAFTFCCMVCFACISQAQLIFSFHSLIPSYKDSAVAYRGYENNITLSNIDSSSQVKITSKHGEIYHSEYDENFQFVYKSSAPEFDTLSVFVNGDFVELKTIKVDRLPDPKLLLAGKPSGKINKKTFLTAPYFVPIFPDCYLNIFTVVTSFTIEVNMNGNIEFYQINGNIIPPFIVENIAAYDGKVILNFDRVILGGVFCPRSTSFQCELF